MNQANKRSRIFISHSSKDENFVLELAEHIEKEFGEDSFWVDYFDLTAGDELAITMPLAIQSSNWFILIASRSSMESRWVQYEARLATLMAIEDKNYRIITIKIDDCDFPDHLDIQLRERKYIEVGSDKAKALRETILSLKQDPSLTRFKTRVFVNRGIEKDKIELAFRSYKVIYVVGMRGIGKTSFVEEVLRRDNLQPISINLRVGHDLELISRQIISFLGSEQPSSDTSDIEICLRAINILSQ